MTETLSGELTEPLQTKPQVGEYWRDGLGEIIGPLEACEENFFPLEFNTVTYTADGRYYRDESSEYDLISRVHLLTDAEHAEWEAGKAKAKELADENARLLKAIADDRPNGKWLDRFGACRVCEGEIPHGHTLDCDLYKMERQIKELEQTISDTRSAAGLETDQSADEEKPISPTMLRRDRRAHV